MKTPITYYGGKQKLASTILKLIPKHKLYCEPFIGGAAIFFAKEPSPVEVINDVNSEMINFYRVVQNDFVGLERHIRITLHSRKSFREASVIYNNPDMFSDIQRAWAVWCLAAQGFAGLMDGSWGYDVAKNTTTKKITNKRESFTEEYAIRLQNVQIECADALRIIRTRESLLKLLAQIEGKFLLSSYPSPLLKQYTKAQGWHTIEIKQAVSVAHNNSTKGRKLKTEVLTANYPLKGD